MINEGTNVLQQHKQKRLVFDSTLKQINFLGNRVYQRDEDIYYPSVTTILQYFPKSRWFEDWLKDVGHNADLIRDKAGKEGSQVHEAIELLVKGEEINWLDDYGNAKYSLTVWGMIVKFYEFWTTHKPELLSSEQFVYSDKHKYAGTADLLVKLDDEVWLLDVKTSNSLHTSYNLQLAAYATAIEEVTDIKVEKTGILWLKSLKRTVSAKKGVYQGKGWEIKPIDDIEKNMKMFLNVYDIFLMENGPVEPDFKTLPISLKI